MSKVLSQMYTWSLFQAIHLQSMELELRGSFMVGVQAEAVLYSTSNEPAQDKQMWICGLNLA